MAAQSLNLQGLHGRDRVQLRDYFERAGLGSTFLKDVAFNDNKAIRQASFNGTQKRWLCSDDSFLWFVLLSKKHPSTQRETKLPSIPAGSWYVSKMNLLHLDVCSSSRKPASRQLARLTGLQSALFDCLYSARLRVATSLKCVNNVNVDNQQVTTYRAMDQGKPQLASAASSTNEY